VNTIEDCGSKRKSWGAAPQGCLCLGCPSKVGLTPEGVYRSLTLCLCNAVVRGYSEVTSLPTTTSTQVDPTNSKYMYSQLKSRPVDD